MRDRGRETEGERDGGEIQRGGQGERQRVRDNKFIIHRPIDFSTIKQ